MLRNKQNTSSDQDSSLPAQSLKSAAFQLTCLTIAACPNLNKSEGASGQFRVIPRKDVSKPHHRKAPNPSNDSRCNPEACRIFLCDKTETFVPSLVRQACHVRSWIRNSLLPLCFLLLLQMQLLQAAHISNSGNAFDVSAKKPRQVSGQSEAVSVRHHRQSPNQHHVKSEEDYPDSSEEDYDEDYNNQQPQASSNCTWCQFREEVKSFRIQEIKAHILKSLGIKKTPNMTGRPTLKQQIPSLINLMGMQKESAPQIEEDEERVKTKRVLIFSQENPQLNPILKRFNVQFFKISRKVTKDKVAKANLWLYMRVNEALNPVKIQLYNVDIEKHQSPTLTQISEKSTERYLQSGSANWVTVDVKKVVLDWLRENPFKEEFCLGIQVKDAHNTPFDEDKVVILSDTEDKSNTMQRPFLEIYTESSKKHRSRRSTGLTCDENSAETRCCRYPLTVDFVEFGWDWIIAPTKYEANYCAGDCPFFFLQKFPHAHIVQQAKPGGKAGPCCAPRKMSPISMLYFNNLYNVVYSTLPGMVVDKCGCS